jgi:PKD repeat protein
VTYVWDLGDGNSDNGAEISYQYAAPGTYTATVTAANSTGQVLATTVVQVEAPAFMLYLPVILKP